MGLETKRSLSSPSLLFRKFNLQRSNSGLPRNKAGVAERWLSFTGGSWTRRRRAGPLDEVAEEGPCLLPAIPIVSSFFCDDPQGQLITPQPTREDEGSTSWTRIPVLTRGSNCDVLLSAHAKRVPKFSLESRSDLDLSQHLSPEVYSAPVSARLSPVPSSLSLAPPSMLAPLPRPHLVRRDAKGNPSRRSTFAMTMTDEQITDEVLVEELEKMRAIRSWAGSGDDLQDFWDIGGSYRNSPYSPSTEGSEPQHQFFDELACESPSPVGEEGLDALSITATTNVHSPPNRSPCRSSLPSFPVHHRFSHASSSSLGPSAPTSARASLLDASDATWHTARRALLTCRECVRTERHYLSAMRALVSQETETPPPSLMLKHAEQLVAQSERLLARMEENPNVWGVTAAFLGEEVGLEEGFVAWCGLVGGWFAGSIPQDDHNHKDKGKSKESHSLHFPAFSSPKEKHPPRKLARAKEPVSGDEKHDSPLKRTASSWKRTPATGTLEAMPTSGSSSESSSSSSSSASSSASTSTSATSTPETSHPSSSASNSKPVLPSPSSATLSFVTSSFLHRKRGREKEKESGSESGTKEAVSSASSLTSASIPSGTSSHTNGAAQPTPATKQRKPAVRDLAILPTQRVMRYVLLFRDLLAHTPATAPSRPLVERALDVAVRIADKCDQAQDNSAFAHMPTAHGKHHGGSRSDSGHGDSTILTWTRRLSVGSFHGKSFSDCGHGTSSTADAAAAALGSLPSGTPGYAKPSSPAPKVLVKPKRSSSTGAVADLANGVGSVGSARSSKSSLSIAPDRARQRSSDSPKLLTKSKRSRSHTRLNSPPPSSFPLGGRKELINGAYVLS